MATARQRKAVDKLVENGGKSVSGAMRAAGYEPKTAKNPKKLTESDGYKEILEEYGLTESLIVTSLVEDIKMKPQNRTPELQLGAKLKGMLVEKTDMTTNGKDIQPLLVKFIGEDEK